MRIAYIAAGAGGSYCGACTRDVALARGLTARGHDVLLLPLYTPLRSDLAHPGMGRIFYGGINAYLQQRFGLFRRTPRFIDWLFDRPALLRAVSRFAIETEPEGLGEMTVSVLRGTEGRQRKELEKLVAFLEREHRPDVVNLTNSLLSAVAPEIKRRMGVPLFCTLQGEETFVARLPQPHRDEAQRADAGATRSTSTCCSRPASAMRTRWPSSSTCPASGYTSCGRAWSRTITAPAGRGCASRSASATFLA